MAARVQYYAGPSSLDNSSIAALPFSTILQTRLHVPTAASEGSCAALAGSAGLDAALGRGSSVAAILSAEEFCSLQQTTDWVSRTKKLIGVYTTIGFTYPKWGEKCTLVKLPQTSAAQ